MVVAFERILFRLVAASCTTSAPPDVIDSTFEVANANCIDTGCGGKSGLFG
jgi:hypothetical protein